MVTYAIEAQKTVKTVSRKLNNKEVKSAGPLALIGCIVERNTNMEKGVRLGNLG